MLISSCALVGKLILSAVFLQTMQSFPTSCWIPKFNRRNFVDVKVMLSLSIKNLWTLLRTASQSWLHFVLFTWNLVFQSSANYVLYKRSKILHYSICGALQVYLDVWQSAIMCHQVGFFSQSAFQAWFCIFPLSVWLKYFFVLISFSLFCFVLFFSHAAASVNFLFLMQYFKIFCLWVLVEYSLNVSRNL